jgi:hypothetical protein
MADTVRVGMQVHGLKPALQTLMYLDRDLYKTTTKEIVKVSKPLVTVVQGAFPQTVLSGFMKPTINSKRKGGPFPTYKVAQVRRGVSAKVGGRKNAYTNSWPIVRIQQRNGAAMVFDMAQRQQTTGNTFVANLKKEGYGNASRVMWKTVTRNLHLVEKNVADAVAKVEVKINHQLEASVQRRQAQSDFTKTQGRNSLGQFGR